MQHEKQNTSAFWNPTFHNQFRGFHEIATLASQCWQSLASFPELKDYNNWLHHFKVARSFLSQDRSIKFVQQNDTSSFERKIYVDREIMTRANNWHDFFNNLTWILWPKLKWAIIKRYVEDNDVNDSNNQRTTRQSFLAQLDECGVLLITSQPEIAQDIIDHQWERLFYLRKDRLENLQVHLFGHGLLEKGLNPYLGMTGKALILLVDQGYFQLSEQSRVEMADEVLSNFILSEKCFSTPKQLQPFPILGLTEWFQGNHTQSFFKNIRYFRPKRNLSIKCAELNSSLDKTLWGQWEWLFLPH